MINQYPVNTIMEKFHYYLNSEKDGVMIFINETKPRIFVSLSEKRYISEYKDLDISGNITVALKRHCGLSQFY